MSLDLGVDLYGRVRRSPREAPALVVEAGSTGVVLDASGALPPAGRVLDEAEAPLAGVRPARRDAKGALADSAATPRVGSTSRAWRREPRVTATQPGGQRHTVRVETTAGAKDVEIRFGTGATVQGRLLGGSPPYRGYYTLLLASDRSGMPRTGAVAEDGTFSLITQEGVSYDLWVLGQGVELFGRVEGLVGGAHDLDVALQPGHTIAGRIEGLDAQQLAASSKLRVTAAGAANAWGAAQVAEDGTWRLTGLPPGRYRLAAMGLPSGFALADGVGEVESGATAVVLRVAQGDR
ncbi:MAG: hypothetical protein R3F05_19680 [Planctomycetota bacterium]